MVNPNISTFPKQINIMHKCHFMVNAWIGGVSVAGLQGLGLLAFAVAS